MRKIRVGILFGGKSAEHEISLISAKNIIESIDREKYDVVLIAIDKKGVWHLKNEAQYLANEDNPRHIRLTEGAHPLALVPQADRKEIMSYAGNQVRGGLALDVIFPVLHGPMGEDGTVQGLLKLANIPFVGAGVLGSAVGMDKDVMKRLLRDAGLPVAKFRVLHRAHWHRMDLNQVIQQLGLPLFVKPANLGSSVGITKVKEEKNLIQAIELAFQYDRKILIEEYVEGREIECSVLGNDEPIASLPGELIPQAEFYSYEAKYLDENGAHFCIPAELPTQQRQAIQAMACDVYRALCVEGMARVDFFLRPNGALVVNEINTIPGFTQISMYPKMWGASGLSYAELIDRLIELAFERHQQESQKE